MKFKKAKQNNDPSYHVEVKTPVVTTFFLFILHTIIVSLAEESFLPGYKGSLFGAHKLTPIEFSECQMHDSLY